MLVFAREDTYIIITLRNLHVFHKLLVSVGSKLLGSALENAISRNIEKTDYKICLILARSS